jgi:hypothetical protein
MTPEQISNAKKILREELEASSRAMGTRFVRNGEDFPDLATSALELEEIRHLLEVGFIGMIMVRMAGADQLKAKIRAGDLARDEGVNMVPLDFLWLGYRLGRRMEHAEMEAMEGFNRRSER